MTGSSSPNPIVIDTHPLIWYFENNTRLSPTASNAFDLIDSGYFIGVIPTMVLAEIMHIADRGRIDLTFEQTIDRIDRSPNFAIVPLDLRILRYMVDLSTLDIHDRIIVATALYSGARLITRDRLIRSSGNIECIW